jgi:hypothetical protein
MLIMHAELQAEQPQLYESLTTNLNPDEQTIVQGVVHQADAIAAQAVAAAQAEAQTPNGGA